MVSDKRIYQLIPPKSEESLPILFESPHSGTFHPEHGEENISQGHVYAGVDRAVHRIFGFAPEIGAPLLHAFFCRCYIDANRALDDMRPDWFDAPWPQPLSPSEKSHNGIGLVWPDKDGACFSPQDILARISTFYSPYHQAIRDELMRMHTRYGYALHVSCHSAPDSIMKPQINPRVNYTADIVISDNFGHTSAPFIGKILRRALTEHGYKVLSNDPFQGDELINANGTPQNHIHSIQIEINRGLYMHEATHKIDEHRLAMLSADLKQSFIALYKEIQHKM
jgi:N-formylglutamate amidohydrolase|tara:strand:- start:340133 stop:340975 length:843 start_codon:yes stop_codon:yes gene_type:complete